MREGTVVGIPTSVEKVCKKSENERKFKGYFFSILRESRVAALLGRDAGNCVGGGTVSRPALITSSLSFCKKVTAQNTVIIICVL